MGQMSHENPLYMGHASLLILQNKMTGGTGGYCPRLYFNYIKTDHLPASLTLARYSTPRLVPFSSTLFKFAKDQTAPCPCSMSAQTIGLVAAVTQNADPGTYVHHCGSDRR